MTRRRQPAGMLCIMCKMLSEQQQQRHGRQPDDEGETARDQDAIEGAGH